jgi:hypothetical protein
MDSDDTYEPETNEHEASDEDDEDSGDEEDTDEDTVEDPLDDLGGGDVGDVLYSMDEDSSDDADDECSVLQADSMSLPTREH